MKLTNETIIKIKSGDGGNGFVDFARDGISPLGGNGGNGGNVYLDIDPYLRTFSSLKHIYIAPNGKNGKPKNGMGKNGEELIIYLPKNTKVTLNGNTFVIKKRVKILQGGKGGYGNKTLTNIYKSKIAKVEYDPQFKMHKSEKGQKTKTYLLKMELNFIADVGLLGKPSSGKSTLISKMTNLKAKIGAYDFTTLEPALAMANIDNRRSFAMLDLPGIIKGASLGKGKGEDVIEYILKTKIILHILDFGTVYKDPINDFKDINNEIYSYSNKIKNIKQIVIANKMDIPGSRIKLKIFKMKYPNINIIPIVAIENKGVKNLLEYLWKQINY